MIFFVFLYYTFSSFRGNNKFYYLRRRNLNKNFSGSAPVGWTCPPGFYNTSDGCDCDCGIFDPDCLINPEIYGCINGYIPKCNSSGLCEYGTVPQQWTCNPGFYGSGDGCDCGCGIYDPDCDHPEFDIYNCNDGINPNCSSTGHCVYEDGVDQWKCNPLYYNAGDGCDCGCGLHDPDCDAGGPSYGCPCEEMACIDGECVGNCPEDKNLATIEYVNYVNGWVIAIIVLGTICCLIQFSLNIFFILWFITLRNVKKNKEVEKEKELE